MREIHINPRIIKALGFSSNESAVFAYLLKSNSIFGHNMSDIARSAGINARSVSRILVDFEIRGLVKRIEIPVQNRKGHLKRCHWKYLSGLEKLGGSSRFVPFGRNHVTKSTKSPGETHAPEGGL